MTATLKALVYVSRLSKAEKDDLYKVDSGFPEQKVGEALREAIQDVLVDRLILAHGCLETAKRLASPTADEEDLRAAVNRAYYSVHHAIRVLILREIGFEADGHELAIQELKRLLRDEDFRRRSGLDEDVVNDISEARDNRSVADYSPYIQSRRDKKADPIPITDDNWRKASEFNIRLAERIHDAVYRSI